MNKIFKQLSFWNLFAFLERDDMDEEELEEQLEELAKDFNIKSNSFEFEHEGQDFTGETRTITFEFYCGSDYDLNLEYTPHPESSEKQLFLVNKTTEERHLMGWWNLENWHPFCLKEEELNELIAYWQTQDTQWSNPDLSLVILHDFVGFDNEAAADAFSLRVFEAFQRLAVRGFNKAPQKPVAVFYYEDRQYYWEEDEKLGSVYDSKVYACYSIRNAAHAAGQEGRFPFEEWQLLMDDLVIN
jgi:hypothetical protein